MQTPSPNLREINREIVSALIFSSDNKLLMGMKDAKAGGVYADCWHIPGGGTDGEDLRIALNREIAEEVGINIADLPVELIDDQGRGEAEKVLKDTGERVLCHMKFNVYKVTLLQNTDNIELLPTDDLIVLGWFGLEELSELKLTPPSIALFKRIGYL